MVGAVYYVSRGGPSIPNGIDRPEEVALGLQRMAASDKSPDLGVLRRSVGARIEALLVLPPTTASSASIVDAPQAAADNSLPLASWEKRT